jgi:hypothetical protein
MISTLGVIIIAVGASVSFFIGAALSIILVLRANDRKRRNQEEVARQFGAGQRGRLSVGSSNYSHVIEPRASLRRSTHLPYGVVPESWAAIPSQETLPQYQRGLVNDRPDAADANTHQKRRRSLRASFSSHSFSLPKTRRQKKIEKAIPLRAMPRSPLSAITEQSGTNTTEASPSVGIAELPTEITPKSTPDRDGNVQPIRRPFSPQWPLTTSNRISRNGASTIIPVPPSRNSTLMRMSSAGHSISPIQPSLLPRTISVASTISTAPEDPLPPLPSITPNQWPTGRKSRLRLSAASVDTIGSSVLGGERMSLSQPETDLTSIGLGTPPIDLNPIGLQAYDQEIQGWEPATVINTGSPKARHATKYRTGKAGYGSLRASIGHHSSSPNIKSDQVPEPRDGITFIPRPAGSSLDTADLRGWRSNLSSRANSVRSSVSPSIADPIARTGSGYKKGAVAARHSMYEQQSGIGRFNADPDVLRDVSDSRTSPLRHPASSRPASIASENPFHRDRNNLQTGLSYGLRTSPGSQHKGHKRQNCVRISNIPVVDTNRRSSKLPQMKEEEEEEEDSSETAAGQTMTIPGLTLLQQEKQIENADSGENPLNSSPFLTRPILEPTSWKRPRYSRAPSSESVVSNKRDSDVFSNSRYDANAPNIFTENSMPRRPWPLSPTTPYRAKPHPTPPSLRAIQEPCDPDSPTLPMPIISSAALFARALPLGSRVSGVQGPRSIPISTRSSRTASPTPTTARAAAKREDLRRSVITLRRINSDAKDKTRMSQICYRNIGDESASSSLDINHQSEQGSVAQPSVGGGENVSSKVRSPDFSATNLQNPCTNHPRFSISPSISSTLTAKNLGLRKSRTKIAPSPSTVSATATSIWEDASVRGDSPEPELPTSSKLPSPQLVDVEAYENFMGRDAKRDHQRDRDGDRDMDRERERRLTSPQGKGLGLMGVQIQGKVWGTPGSLYDRDGFLKE